MKRPTLEPHYGYINLSKTFEEAFDFVVEHPEISYKTSSGKSFTAEARIVAKGSKAGEKVIIFKRFGKESARSYCCCWGKKTNCNRTYIDSYCCHTN